MKLKLHSKQLSLSLAISSLLWLGLLIHHHTASATSGSTTCDSLSTTLSDDKNYYLFTAGATVGGGDHITGYKFDFGDQQSYTVHFNSDTKDTHEQATTTHIYEKTGTYQPKVTVLVTRGGKSAQVSSQDCTSHVTIQPAGQLVDTGPGDVVVWFLAASVVGTMLHRCVLKYGGPQHDVYEI